MAHIYIHGHACIHNLIDTSVDYEDDPYLALHRECLYTGETPVAAWHPFSAFYKDITEYDASCTIACDCDYNYTTTIDDMGNRMPRIDQWSQVCTDYGTKVPIVMHPWNSFDVYGLWAVVQTFNWAMHRIEMGSEIEHPDFIYESWYTTLFSKHFSRELWTEVTHGRKV